MSPCSEVSASGPLVASGSACPAEQDSELPRAQAGAPAISLSRPWALEGEDKPAGWWLWSPAQAGLEQMPQELLGHWRDCPCGSFPVSTSRAMFSAADLCRVCSREAFPRGGGPLPRGDRVALTSGLGRSGQGGQESGSGGGPAWPGGQQGLPGGHRALPVSAILTSDPAPRWAGEHPSGSVWIPHFPGQSLWESGVGQVVASWGCGNHAPQTGGLTRSLTVRRPESGIQGSAGLVLEGSDQDYAWQLPSSGALLAVSGLTAVDTWPHLCPISCRRLPACLSVSRPPLCQDTSQTGAHPPPVRPPPRRQ